MSRVHLVSACAKIACGGSHVRSTGQSLRAVLARCAISPGTKGCTSLSFTAGFPIGTLCSSPKRLGTAMRSVVCSRLGVGVRSIRRSQVPMFIPCAPLRSRSV